MTRVRGPNATLTAGELAEFLASALGDAKALELVEAAMTTLNLGPARLTRSEVLRVLELIATEPGLYGIAARFVKSRLLLEWPV